MVSHDVDQSVPKSRSSHGIFAPFLVRATNGESFAGRGYAQRRSLVIAIAAALFSGLFLGNLYQVASLEPGRPMIHLRPREPIFRQSYDEAPAKQGSLNFDPFSGRDVIVFLQIQNAGANFFEKNLLENLALPNEPACNCSRKNAHRRSKCRCHNGREGPGKTPWLFSRLSKGWPCGVHADWTRLHGCVDRVLDEVSGEPRKRRYLYMTILREPVRRFRSEWLRFVEQRGPRPSGLLCGGRERFVPGVQECFKKRDLSTVTLGAFAACKDNLGTNRQTRMLADLRLISCDGDTMNQTERDMIMLHSAKNNLLRMAFFGIAEFPNVSQKMFEAAFGMEFRSRPHGRFNRLSSYIKRGRNGENSTNLAQTEALIRRVNHLDVELYEYAKELLFGRFNRFFKEGLDEDEDPDWADGDDMFND